MIGWFREIFCFDDILISARSVSGILIRTRPSPVPLTVTPLSKATKNGEIENEKLTQILEFVREKNSENRIRNIFNRIIVAIKANVPRISRKILISSVAWTFSAENKTEESNEIKFLLTSNILQC